MKRKNYFLALYFCIFAIVFISCTSTYTFRSGGINEVKYEQAEVSNLLLVQIASIDFATPRPGDQINTIFIDRRSSPQVDFTSYEGGVWYRNFYNKIVSIEAFYQLISINADDIQPNPEITTITNQERQLLNIRNNVWRVDYITK